MVSSVGKKFAEVDRAYLAGMIDADGAIMASIESHAEKKYGYRVRMILKLTQKFREVLESLHQLYKVGYVTKNRTTHDWVIKDQTYVREILLLIRPYCLVKQQQIALALQILDTKVTTKEDLLYIARLADTLSGYNVRSLNRRKNYTSKIQASFSSND